MNRLAELGSASCVRYVQAIKVGNANIEISSSKEQ